MAVDACAGLACTQTVVAHCPTPGLHHSLHPHPIRGLEISLKTLGPAYRIVCRDAAEPSSNNGSSSGGSGSGRRRRSSAELAAEEAAAGVGGPGRVLAVTSGFLVPPLRLMHCDTLQVFTRGLRGEEGARARGGVLGLGLLMGAATLAFGRAAGCTKAEILAINGEGSYLEWRWCFFVNGHGVRKWGGTKAEILAINNEAVGAVGKSGMALCDALFRLLISYK